jgi:AcrR family transcriptional regulator
MAGSLPVLNENSIFRIESKRNEQRKSPAAPRLPGRPRSEGARRHILESAYKFLKTKPMSSITAHEVAAEAGVSTATLYRWWDTKEEILFEACLEHLKDRRPAGRNGSPLARLRQEVSRSAKWIRSEEGKIMARILAGIQGDRELQRSYLEKFYFPRRQMQRQLVEEAVAASELRAGADPDLVIDALFGPLFFRWVQGHAPMDQTFATAVADEVFRAFAP